MLRRLDLDFVLIEAMVVVLILGLLATIVLQSLRGTTDKASAPRGEPDRFPKSKPRSTTPSSFDSSLGRHVRPQTRLTTSPPLLLGVS
jgi:hypothetical protein